MKKVQVETGELKIFLEGGDVVVLSSSCEEEHSFLGHELFSVYVEYLNALEVPKEDDWRPHEYMQIDMDHFRWVVVEEDRGGGGYHITTNLGGMNGYESRKDAKKDLDAFLKGYSAEIRYNDEKIERVRFPRERIIAVTHTNRSGTAT